MINLSVVRLCQSLSRIYLHSPSTFMGVKWHDVGHLFRSTFANQAYRDAISGRRAAMRFYRETS
jgi:hypothetical protein